MKNFEFDLMLLLDPFSRKLGKSLTIFSAKIKQLSSKFKCLDDRLSLRVKLNLNFAKKSKCRLNLQTPTFLLQMNMSTIKIPLLRALRSQKKGLFPCSKSISGIRWNLDFRSSKFREKSRRSMSLKNIAEKKSLWGN